MLLLWYHREDHYGQSYLSCLQRVVHISIFVNKAQVYGVVSGYTHTKLKCLEIPQTQAGNPFPRATSIVLGSIKGTQHQTMQQCLGQHHDGHEVTLGSSSQETGTYFTDFPFLYCGLCGLWTFPKSLKSVMRYQGVFRQEMPEKYDLWTEFFFFFQGIGFDDLTYSDKLNQNQNTDMWPCTF